MAAGLGFKTFTTGEVLTAADVNGYLMQGVLVFASAAARNAAITSPQEGQFAFTKDTNGLWYYDGAAWVASGATGDIEGVTAGVGITGGGTSGTVTITNDMATTITAAGDIVVGTGSGTYDNLPIGTTAQVLTADTTVSPYKVKWATPAASASGLTLVSSSTMSAVNSKSMDSVFTSTYDNYQIQISFVPSAGDNVSVTMRASGADNTTSNYDFFNMRAQYGGTVSVPDTGLAQSKWTYMGSVDGTYYVTYVFDVMGPNLARNTTIKGRGEQILTTSGYGMFLATGNFRASTVFDGIKIALNGAPTMTGEIRVYGYQKS